MCSSKIKGSMAVEAVFVVPLCLMVIFLLLESGLYLHHQSWYREAAWECILAGADAEEAAAETLTHWKSLSMSQVFPVRSVSAKVTEKGGSLNMSLQGGVSGVWGSDGMNFMIQVQREQISPAQFVRKIHMLRKLGEEDAS